MYIHEGASGAPTARLFRSDDAQTATPASGDRPVELEPGRPGLRHVQRLHRTVLVRQLRLHARRATPTSSTSAARTPTARPGISNKPRSRALDGRRVRRATDMTMDGTDSCTPTVCTPTSTALVTNPSQPVPVLRVERRRPHALERRLHRRVVSGATPRGITEPTLARCQQLLSRVPDEAGEHEQGLSDAPVPEPLGQPVQRRTCCRAARRTTAPGRRRATRRSGTTR